MIASVVVDNLLSAPVIAFVVAIIATLARFDLRLPESLYPILSAYLLLAIGSKGGKALADADPAEVWMPVIGAVLVGVLTPLVAFAAMRFLGRIDTVNASALAAHYGSVSAVTFTVVLATLEASDISYEGFVTGLLAILEVIGILVGLLLAGGSSSGAGWREAVGEVVRGRSVALLVGGLVIGGVVGAERLAPTDPLFVGLFTGALSLFLLELGVVAAEQLRDVSSAGWRLVALGVAVPIVNGSIGAVLGALSGLSTGGVAVLATLAASASYIAAPAAVRIALPKASPGLYVTASLGITFPFNIVVGIPIYVSIAKALT